MTITDMLDKVMAIAREAVAGDLLTDIDSLTTTVRAVSGVEPVPLGGRNGRPRTRGGRRGMASLPTG